MKKTKFIPDEIKFTENQKFKQLWLWIIINIPVITTLFLLLNRFFMKNAPQNQQEHDTITLIILAFLLLLVPLLFFVLELRTRVTGNAIYIQFFPFHTKWLCFSFSEIASFSNVTYRPLLEYGGWGIRYSLNGKAYNVSGNRGIRLIFKDGKKLLIGSRDPDRFEKAIRDGS
jgi:hypothetical protein